MAEDTLIPNQILHGEGLYAQAIDAVLAKAQHRILIFDQDLSQGNFASPAKYAVLQHFLSTYIAGEICFILHQADYLLKKCPRLMNLLRAYPHKMRVYVTDDTVKNFKSCFIIIDDIHYVKRIHIDQARFKFAYDDAIQSEILHQQFLELRAAAPESITFTTLGL